jgi:hypothetical protein
MEKDALMQIRVPSEWQSKVRKEAVKRGMNLSQFVREVVDEYFERREGAKSVLDMGLSDLVELVEKLVIEQLDKRGIL